MSDIQLPDYSWEHPQESDYEEARAMSDNATLVARLHEFNVTADGAAPICDEAGVRIAELEAERDAFRDQSIELTADCYAAEAERDRLKAALEEISISNVGRFAIPADHVTWAIWRARAALSGPSGEKS